MVELLPIQVFPYNLRCDAVSNQMLIFVSSSRSECFLFFQDLVNNGAMVAMANKFNETPIEKAKSRLAKLLSGLFIKVKVCVCQCSQEVGYLYCEIHNIPVEDK